MLTIQVIPRGDENIYRILRRKIDNGARTLVWTDKKKLRLKHTQPAHSGRIHMCDADGVLVADTHEGDQIVGAFIARLAAWFPAEIAAINIQVLADGKTKKKAKKK
jgi:hypothetical protein